MPDSKKAAAIFQKLPQLHFCDTFTPVRARGREAIARRRQNSKRRTTLMQVFWLAPNRSGFSCHFMLCLPSFPVTGFHRRASNIRRIQRQFRLGVSPNSLFTRCSRTPQRTHEVNVQFSSKLYHAFPLFASPISILLHLLYHTTAEKFVIFCSMCKKRRRLKRRLNKPSPILRNPSLNPSYPAFQPPKAPG